MGIPTFTFETDDEQFVPGSVEALNERLEEEMDVMRYLISNVWYWRARLDVQDIQVSDEEVMLNVNNLGRASTSNATLQFLDSTGMVTWTSSLPVGEMGEPTIRLGIVSRNSRRCSCQHIGHTDSKCEPRTVS